MADEPHRILIDTKIRSRLKIEKGRTGYTPEWLLHDRADIPGGLNAAMIADWVNGTLPYAAQKHLDYVLELYSALPIATSRKHKMQKIGFRQPRMPITDEFLHDLHNEKIRTGIGCWTLFSQAKRIPEGLSVTMLVSWLKGKVKSATQEHMDFVREEWARLPDMGLGVEKVPIADNTLATLQAERDRTGLGGTALLAERTDKPTGLTAFIISGWLAGQTKSAFPAHLDYVLTLYAAAETRIAISDHLVALLSEASAQIGGWKRLIPLFRDPPDILTSPKLSRIANRYDVGIAEPLATYLTAECEHILK